MKPTLERESSKKAVKTAAHKSLPKEPLQPKEPIYPQVDPNQLPDDYVPFNANSKKLDYPIPQGYKGYWQLDQPGMIESMKRAYWQPLIDERTGEPVTMPNKNGGTLHLMITPEAYYNEAMRRQQEEHDRRLDGIAAVDEREGQYTPMGMPRKNTSLKYS